MVSKSLLVLASAASLASCQSNSTINPTSVPYATRQAWCGSQTSSCPLLCLQLPGASGSPTTNTCDAATLNYECVCSNGVSPNATEYSQTIPYYTCTEHNNQCVTNCNGDSSCQYDCRSDNPCGARAPKHYNLTTTTASTATATATETPVNTKVNGSTGAAPRMFSIDMSHLYGLCAVVGAFTAGFASLM
ncbi:hypothetical protein PENANT_c003G01525 [Penicillium antarcticum]|uniref:DUF7707 domain-containing protein n=1 Tax=Penicillium antarcticum TaxID=416450 RepID=A0A1V6QIP1_9EURO|nr:uncharacterized protein N7508_005730 [Penicillium antarcticum]KAJ5306715.1 hypothetical protein N7508_005730 [Penicillium antarcticum]OQD89080.1 hypothetical protein PENANT_c003G01525 [Penicillium antarcticum]